MLICAPDKTTDPTTMTFFAPAENKTYLLDHILVTTQPYLNYDTVGQDFPTFYQIQRTNNEMANTRQHNLNKIHSTMHYQRQWPLCPWHRPHW